MLTKLFLRNKCEKSVGNALESLSANLGIHIKDSEKYIIKSKQLPCWVAGFSLCTYVLHSTEFSKLSLLM